MKTSTPKKVRIEFKSVVTMFAWQTSYRDKTRYHPWITKSTHGKTLVVQPLKVRIITASPWFIFRVDIHFLYLYINSVKKKKKKEVQ